MRARVLTWDAFFTGSGAQEAADTGEELAADCSSWEAFSNTHEKSQLWQLAHDNHVDSILRWMEVEPCLAKARTEDGRGPLFWAYEFQLKQLAEAFTSAGTDPNAKDTKGKRARDMTKLPMAQWPEPTPKDAEEQKV